MHTYQITVKIGVIVHTDTIQTDNLYYKDKNAGRYEISFLPSPEIQDWLYNCAEELDVDVSDLLIVSIKLI